MPAFFKTILIFVTTFQIKLLMDFSLLYKRSKKYFWKFFKNFCMKYHFKSTNDSKPLSLCHKQTTYIELSDCLNYRMPLLILVLINFSSSRKIQNLILTYMYQERWNLWNEFEFSSLLKDICMMNDFSFNLQNTFYQWIFWKLSAVHKQKIVRDWVIAWVPENP